MKKGGVFKKMFTEHLLYPRYTAACALCPESRADFPAWLSSGDASSRSSISFLCFCNSTKRGRGGGGKSQLFLTARLQLITKECMWLQKNHHLKSNTVLIVICKNNQWRQKLMVKTWETGYMHNTKVSQNTHSFQRCR